MTPLFLHRDQSPHDEGSPSVEPKRRRAGVPAQSKAPPPNPGGAALSHSALNTLTLRGGSVNIAE
jgi:hypothetical protein